MKFISLFLVGLLCTATVISAVEINSRQFISMNTSSSHSKVPATLSNVAVEFSINVPAMAAAFKSSYSNITLTEFPISKTETATLYLTPSHSVIDTRSEFYAGSKRIGLPDVISYKGAIEGEPNSKVLLNYANGDLVGSIRRENGERLTVSPYGSSKTDERTHTVAPGASIEQITNRPLFKCGTDESVSNVDIPPASVRKDKSAAEILSTKPLEVEIIVETTTGFFTGPGRNDEDKAGAYVVALYNMVSLIYEEEMNMTYHINKVQIWTVDDPDNYEFSGATTGHNDSLLTEVVERWRGRSIQRDLVNVLSRPGASRILGIARGIGGICNNTDGSLSAYAVCGISNYGEVPTFAYDDEVATIAHENGHVFGAKHTHNCDWKPPLDSCTTKTGSFNDNFFSGDACNEGTPIYNTGSIMSYCHLWGRGLPMTFLPRVYNFLRNEMEGKSCLKEPGTSLVRVQLPRGNQVLKSGLDTVIHWTASSDIQKVRIEFSSDEGVTWETVPGGDNVDAKQGSRDYGQGTIPWKVPAANTKKGLIRVSNQVDGSVFGTCLAPFSIESTVLTIQNPLGGETFGQSEKPEVQWKSSLVNNVKIELSTDGGGSWTTAGSAAATGTFSLELPRIETNSAMVRVSDASNNNLVSQSGKFSIGKEWVGLRTPHGGDTVCASQPFTIAWYTNNIGLSTSKVRIYYSTDNGTSWSNVTNVVGAEARAGTYTWSGTKIASTSALVKIVYKADTSVSSMSQKVFTISSKTPCTPVGVDEQTQDIHFATMSISPNPISSQGTATVEFPAPCARIECSLVDTKGALVAVLGSYENLSIGKHELSFDISNVASGSYFLTLSCGGQRVSAPLTILR
ncbi:MAG: hypothetical protein HYZ54_05510 [Ignavibacteriae bacterium]|nr:hypothetical protein [Ignavibacteriota bacterium]